MCLTVAKLSRKAFEAQSEIRLRPIKACHSK